VERISNKMGDLHKSNSISAKSLLIGAQGPHKYSQKGPQESRITSIDGGWWEGAGVSAVSSHWEIGSFT
jgi:hypothetical protein